MTAAAPAQSGTLTVFFSLIEISIEPILAECDSDVYVMPPYTSPSTPRTIRINAAIFMCASSPVASLAQALDIQQGRREPDEAVRVGAGVRRRIHARHGVHPGGIGGLDGFPRPGCAGRDVHDPDGHHRPFGAVDVDAR